MHNITYYLFNLDNIHFIKKLNDHGMSGRITQSQTLLDLQNITHNFYKKIGIYIDLTCGREENVELIFAEVV